MCLLLLNGMNVKKMRLNSKFATILIHWNAMWRGKLRSHFNLCFECYKMLQNKEQINFKMKAEWAARVLKGDNTYLDNLVTEKHPILPAFLTEFESPGLCDQVEYLL